MKPTPAVVGTGSGMNGQEAAMQATQRALDQLGTARPVLALVFVSQEFHMGEVLAGLTALLGDTPLFGLSTTRPLTAAGDHPRAVTVALLTGADLRAQVQWYPNYAQDSPGTARLLAHALNTEVFLPQELLLAADGITGSLTTICQAMDDLPMGVSGAMAAGDPTLGKTFTVGRNQAGSGGLAVALLSGSFRVGVGLGHGWQDMGVHLRATRSRDVWLHALDGLPAAEAYARWFGYPAREWAFPPLSDLARIYPLGVEQELAKVPPGSPAPSQVGAAAPESQPPRASLLLRSTLRVEVDGALRMSAPVPEGAVVHLMVGDADACLQAARNAAWQALAGLGSARPLLAVALVDAAWSTLLENRPGELSAALNEALGGLPLAGAYTFGQLARPNFDALPVLHNGNIEVLVFGEEEE